MTTATGRRHRLLHCGGVERSRQWFAGDGDAAVRMVPQPSCGDGDNERALREPFPSLFSSGYGDLCLQTCHAADSIKAMSDVRARLRALRQADPDLFRSVNVAIDMLAEIGPALGRPMVDALQGSTIVNLKELGPPSGRDVAIRVLFVLEP